MIFCCFFFRNCNNDPILISNNVYIKIKRHWFSSSFCLFSSSLVRIDFFFLFLTAVQIPTGSKIWKSRLVNNETGGINWWKFCVCEGEREERWARVCRQGMELRGIIKECRRITSRVWCWRCLQASLSASALLSKRKVWRGRRLRVLGQVVHYLMDLGILEFFFFRVDWYFLHNRRWWLFLFVWATMVGWYDNKWVFLNS